MMRVAIRVDASAWLGSGHVMRCRALASELKSRGHLVVFVMRLLHDNLVMYTRTAGFEVLTLSDLDGGETASQADWLKLAMQPALQLDDANDTLALLDNQDWDWIVADHYALGVIWQQAMARGAKKMLVLDDEANCSLQCDVLVNQNPGAHVSHYDGLTPPHCLRLMGPQYALLRPEFDNAARSDSMHSHAAGSARVLVALGGGNVHKLLLAVLSALGDCGLRGTGITVVAGAQPLHGNELEQRSLALGYTRVCSTENMANLMKDSDWAIGGGGVGLLERCVVGLPSITLITAPNQRRGVMAAQAQGALVAIDPLDADFETRIRQAIKDMLSSPDRLAAMSNTARSVCDGLGTPRVADILQKGSLTLRVATAQDSGALLTWRNAADTRRFSGNSQTISVEQHEQWLQRVLANPAQRLWIACSASGPVGVLRLDTRLAGAATVAEISVYRVPDLPGKGWGRALIACGIQEAQRIWSALSRIDARISDDNLASLAAFGACGFTPSTTPGLHQKHIERICP